MKTKSFKNVFMVSMFLLAFVFMLAPQTVYASGTTTADAVQDIMNHDRFQGAIETIEFITTRVDFWFTALITATSFFIISAALLKNACAGAYVANQKFWNEVAKAHEARDAQSIIQNIQGLKGIFNEAGGLRNFLLSIIPNIKALTDFDDADLEPKAYFMRAIPQMLACVIIGVFIYNGYYRDTAATVGSFGSEICNRVFASVDPVTFVDKITQTTATPENLYANDPTLQGKAIHALSSDLYKTYISITKNMTAIESKTSLMRDCEKMAYEICNTEYMRNNFFSDSRKYDFQMTNINTNAVPASAKTETLDHLSSKAVDTKTDSKYSLRIYKKSPNTAQGYVSDQQQYCYITFVMNGSQRDDSVVGYSNITAIAGEWGNSTTTTVKLTYSVPGDNKETGSGKSVGKGQIDATKIVTDSANQSKIFEAIDKAVKGDNKDITINDHNLKAINNNGGVGANNVNISHKINGDVITFKARYDVKYTKDGDQGTKVIEVPCSVTLQI